MVHIDIGQGPLSVRREPRMVCDECAVATMSIMLGNGRTPEVSRQRPSPAVMELLAPTGERIRGPTDAMMSLLMPFRINLIEPKT